MNDGTLPDLCRLPALYRDGGLDPVALLSASLTQISNLNREINAVVALDRDGAERAAKESADRWRRRMARSSVDGAPVLVKANFAVAGLPWHAGIAAYSDRIAEVDAPVVARLRSAGAIILGLTNMDEGALGATGNNAWLGHIRNPHLPRCSTGGSSGGSAAAVAAGFCMAALGTDTIGSIAIPSAYCGVVGHRASRDLMSMTGIVPLSPSFDHAGWHTRSVRDALALREALGSVVERPEPFRLAVLDGASDTYPSVAQSMENARSSGWEVHRITRPIDFVDIARRMFEVAEAEGSGLHAQALIDRPEGFSPGIRRMFDWGTSKGVERRADHLIALDRIAVTIRALLAGYDALLLPATPHAAHAAGSPPPTDQSMFAALPACLGWPATTIPAGKEGEMALLVTARTDDMCLAVASRL